MPDDPRQPDPRRVRAPKPGSPDWLAWIEQDDHAPTEADRAAMARALAEDPGLRAQVEAMRADRAMLRALASPTAADAIEPPPDLMERIELALERDALLDTPPAGSPAQRHAPHTQPPLPRRHAPFRPRRRAGRWIAPTVALAFIAASLWLVIERPLDPRPSPEPAVPLALAPERSTPSPTPMSPEPLATIAQSDALTGPTPEALAPEALTPETASARAPLDARALRHDLELLLAQDDAELQAARQALAEAHPPAPAERSAIAAASPSLVPGPAEAAPLARAARLAIAVRTDRPAEVHRTLAALARQSTPPADAPSLDAPTALATLRPWRDRRAIAALPPGLAHPPEFVFRAPWLDLNDALVRTGREAAQPHTHPEPQPGAAPARPARPEIFESPAAHAAFAYYRLDVHPTPESLEALRAELARALAAPDAFFDAPSIVIEFIELPAPLHLDHPEPDPLWWLDPTTWRPKAAVPIILTDDHKP